MGYNKYELTPLFSYDETRTVIRELKAEEMHQLRYNPRISESEKRVWFWAQWAVPATLIGSFLILALIY